MKVAFYIDKDLGNINFSNITDGNPGIGGTEYQFLLVSYLLEKRNNGIQPVLLTHTDLLLPHKSRKVCKDLDNVCKFCMLSGIRTVIMNQLAFDENIVDQYSSRLDIVLWDHNGMNLRRLNVVTKRPYIKRIVCCGREMLDMYRDHPATLKSTYIYNIQPLKSKEWYKDKIDFTNNHNVVYMGSIIPAKGFHVLARSWKGVLRQIPDAQLYVIGTGKLYDKNAVLGKYGIAEEQYEESFMSYLTDDNGNIMPSVHFKGLMGIEKFYTLGKCKVAVPNPTGDSECLPLTTMEMQLSGCGITTIYHQAYLDTVLHTEWLYHRCRQLVDYIVKRLNAPRDNYDELYDFISSRFNTDKSLSRWEQTLLHLDDKFTPEHYSSNKYQMKPLKDFLLHVKVKLPFLGGIPLVRNVYRAWQHRVSKNNEW